MRHKEGDVGRRSWWREVEWRDARPTMGCLSPILLKTPNVSNHNIWNYLMFSYAWKSLTIRALLRRSFPVTSSSLCTNMSLHRSYSDKYNRRYSALLNEEFSCPSMVTGLSLHFYSLSIWIWHQDKNILDIVRNEYDNLISVFDEIRMAWTNAAIREAVDKKNLLVIIALVWLV